MSDTYHLVGIGGIGMSGLARLMLSRKMKVSGSDIAFSPLIEKLIKEGAEVHKGHKAENVPHHATLVYSSDIKEDNPEYAAALRMKYKLLHRADLLAELLNEKKALAVAGTHGKTTTTSLLASTLMHAGLDPSFAIGGILTEYQTNARWGEGDYFAFEADESDRSFLKYHPFGAIVTNIDKDHLNNFDGCFPLLIDYFNQFMQQVQEPKHLFWCRDDAYLHTLNLPGQSYGFHPGSDWNILSMSQNGFKIKFDLAHQGKKYLGIEVPIIGRHNALNSAAVFGLAMSLGIAEQSIRNAMQAFKGVLRRCEHKGVGGGVEFIDDYAHHPTEIETTLNGVRSAIGSRKLIAVFQPHRYSRISACLGTFGPIFDAADELIITDLYAAGETPIPNISHIAVKEEVENVSKVNCQYVPRSALSHFLSRFAQPDDVIISLGAGDISKLSSETLVLMENRKEAVQFK